MSGSLETSADLKAVADQIPSMGGRKIGAWLRQAARDAPSNTSIVEVGCWLGAGTAQLALGIRERPCPKDVSLHCYDRWKATTSEVDKALRGGVNLSVGDDTLPWVRQALNPFNVPIRFHKGDVMVAGWQDGRISVYVDDVSKPPWRFFPALLMFGPWWIPGETVIVLMDYDHWKNSGEFAHRCQKQFVEANRDCFEPLGHAGDGKSSGAMFRYRKPVDSINSGKWRGPWDMWLQHRRQQPSAFSMLRVGRWRDSASLLRLHLLTIVGLLLFQLRRQLA